MSDISRKVDYDERLHAHYREGRAHDASVMRQWRELIRRAVGDRQVRTILDLGCGTARFSELLADEFDAHVIGVEPSDKMRAVAETTCRHPQVHFLKGAAEQVPLADESCDLAWLSQITHHVADLEAMARELRRVLRSSGRIVIRGNFQGRLAGFCRFYDFFPTALAVDEARHPSLDRIAHCFHQQGFRRTVCETVEQMEARSLSEYAARIRLRTYSTFELIPAAEFEQGLAALELAARQAGEQPVPGKLDLLVFER